MRHCLQPWLFYISAHGKYSFILEKAQSTSKGKNYDHISSYKLNLANNRVKLYK